MVFTWLVVGATRGIGLEFVKQILERGDKVVATARKTEHAGHLWQLMQTYNMEALQMAQCDVSSEATIDVNSMSC